MSERTLINKQKHHHTKAANSTDSPSRTSLLGLPGEIRNKIYRHALVVHDTSHQPGSDLLDPIPEQPALLRTCEQIRSEAASIYYAENQFCLFLDDFIDTPAIAWIEHASRYVDRQQLQVQWDWGIWGVRHGDWPNLLQMLRHAHEGRLPPFEASAMWSESTGHGTDKHLERLFAITPGLAEVPWTNVEQVLQHYAEGTEIGIPGFM